MTRLFRDQVENDEAQVAMGEEARQGASAATGARGRGRGVLQLADKLIWRWQVGDMGEPDHRHLGGAGHDVELAPEDLHAEAPPIEAGGHLVDRLLVYFENNVSMASSSQQDMGYLFEVLPAALKIQLIRFLNREAIERVPFLGNRSDAFYLNYLEKFKPMRFDKDDIIFERSQKAREIFLVINGEILSVNTNRIFAVGHMIG